MALVTFGVVCPLAARLFVVMGAEIPLITWIIMPRVTRLLSRWLYPGVAS